MSVVAYRPDCLDRWKTISDSLGDITGKSIIDIGCANAFFAEKFLENGGRSAIGVDIDANQRKECSPLVTVFSSIKDITGHFDYCLYLDLHYSFPENYIPWCKEHSDVLFIAPSGDGRKNNARMKEELASYFSTVVELGSTEYAHRMIFKCQ